MLSDPVDSLQNVLRAAIATNWDPTRLESTLYLVIIKQRVRSFQIHAFDALPFARSVWTR